MDGTGRSTIRLSFSQSDERTIESAVAELGRLLHSRIAAAGVRTARKRPTPRGRR